MKFFIPGGAGYIGTHISYMLLENDHDVVILDNFSNSSISSINSLENLSGKKVILYKGDVCNEEILSNIFNVHSFDGVIHLAALKSVSESIEQPKMYHKNNVEGTKCLLAAMRSFDIKNLVFSSSATVYGLPQYLPIDERHPLSSINPYAQTKLNIEQELETIAENEDDWKIVALRYFNPVGAHESGMIGESPLNTPNNIMPYIVNVANKELPYLKIFGNDYDTKDGTTIRDFIHVLDLVDIHIIAAESLINSGENEIYNCGYGVGFSIMDVIKEINSIIGSNLPLEFGERRKSDIVYSVADNQKFLNKFDWKPKYNNLKTILESALKWEKILK